MARQHKKYYFNHPWLWQAIREKTYKKEVVFLEKIFRKHSGIKTILDVGCGTGVHLKELSMAGHLGVGLDLNPRLIAYAKKKNPQLEFVVGDMKKIPLRRKFDAILCLCTVFSYNQTNEEVTQTLGSFFDRLRPGGLLVLDNINILSFIDNLKFQKNVYIDSPYKKFGLTCKVRHKILAKKQMLEEERVILQQGRILQKDKTTFRLFFPQELNHLLSSHGFCEIQHFDGYNIKKQSSLHGFRYVTIAKKYD